VLTIEAKRVASVNQLHMPSDEESDIYAAAGGGGALKLKGIEVIHNSRLWTQSQIMSYLPHRPSLEYMYINFRPQLKRKKKKSKKQKREREERGGDDEGAARAASMAAQLAKRAEAEDSEEDNNDPAVRERREDSHKLYAHLL